MARDSEPSTPVRYEKFRSFVRKHGYIAPALEGVDIDPVSGDPLNPSEYKHDAHYLLDTNLRWVIIPINCANYYGSLEPLEGITEDGWDQILSMAKDYALDEGVRAQKYLMDIRRRDVARITDGQIEHIVSLIDHVNDHARSKGVDPEQIIKIAVVHHHLLPVSNEEEVKPFESMTNLGAFRQFLYDQDFCIVLHGHKHKGYTYWDHIYDFDQGASGEAKRVLVLSAASIRNNDQRNDVCRLLEISPNVYAPTLAVTTLPSKSSGQTLKLGDRTVYELYKQPKRNGAESAVPAVIEGDEAADVYERLIALFSKVQAGKELNNVICQIHKPETISSLVERYPTNPLIYPSKPTEWFDEVVEWWQHNSPSLGENGDTFNHGSRIHCFGGSVDQFGHVADLLKENKTSRATITLLDPDDTNPRKGKKHPFPSLCLVQFELREVSEGYVLDCTGYFRKQEISAWWPINVAELAKLQKAMYDEIRASYSKKNLGVGTVTTIATVAVKSAGIPRVAIPAIDRAYDLDRNKLWNMACALFLSNTNQAEECAALWDGYLNDLIPPEQRDEDGVPVALAGVNYLHETTTQFAQHQPGSKGEQVSVLLGDLYAKNRAFAENTQFGTSKNADNQLKQWRTGVILLVDSLKSLVNTILQPV